MTSRGRRRAVVVGGGIAGLSAALALLQNGWRVSVLERGARFQEVGAGLAVTPNGLAALNAVGLGTPLTTVGVRQGTTGARSSKGSWLLRADPDPRNAVIGIHRQTLLSLLAEAVRSEDDTALRSGTTVTSVEPGDPGGGRAVVRSVRNGDEHREEADLVVAADGVRSGLRRLFFPDSRIAYAGSTAWRAISAATSTTPDSFQLTWGPGSEFGQLRIDADRVYWYGQSTGPEGQVFDDEMAAVAKRFEGWHPPIPATIAGTSPDALIRHDVWYLSTPLRTFVTGRVAFVGDAAHAMTPNLGQGANSALEDGVSLGVLAADGDLRRVLDRYDGLRRPRTQLLARRSLQFGRVGGGLRSRPLIAVRNRLMPLIPASVAARGSALLGGWSPPVHSA